MSIQSDFHLHSSFSGDCDAPMDQMIQSGIAKGLQSMCFTEHNDFDFPEDFLVWNPTCHFKSAAPLVERFMNSLDSQWTKPLLYIWGHSHELRSEEEWQQFETVLKALSGDKRIWYATNMDIFNYVSAQKSLKISADEKIIYNPSNTDVWIEKDKVKVIKIPAGKTIMTC